MEKRNADRQKAAQIRSRMMPKHTNPSFTCDFVVKYIRFANEKNVRGTLLYYIIQLYFISNVVNDVGKTIKVPRK